VTLWTKPAGENSHDHRYPGNVPVSAELTRDVTDTKFLSLAAESGADFLVTNDRRHLLPLKRFEETSIVSPSEFVKNLS